MNRFVDLNHQAMTIDLPILLSKGLDEARHLSGIVGLQQSDQEEAFLKTIDIWSETIAQCPDAIIAAFGFPWDARPAKKPGLESAMCHHDLWFWQ